jgi:Domain of unknown function (DUF1877)
MSMLFSLRRVTQQALNDLIRDPSDIVFYLYGYEPEVPKPGFFARLLGAKTESPVKRTWVAPPDDQVLDLDKNWHILHYLFCRQPWDGPLPQSTLMMGGVELGDIDVGYGPARGLRTDEIEAFLGFLESLKKEEFGRDVTSEEVEENEIYACEWSPDDGQILWEYVDALKAFLKKTKNEQHCVILYLY